MRALSFFAESESKTRDNVVTSSKRKKKSLIPVTKDGVAHIQIFKMNKTVRKMLSWATQSKILHIWQEAKTLKDLLWSLYSHRGLQSLLAYESQTWNGLKVVLYNMECKVNYKNFR